jgi:hypothetical protein
MTFLAFFNTVAMCENCADDKGIPFYQGDGVQQHLHFQGYILHDDNTSHLNYLFANRYDSYEWSTYPVREETLYCAFGSKFAAPMVCPWQLPGCAQPHYPSNDSPGLAPRAFGMWAWMVQLSYFHLPVALSLGMVGTALFLFLLCRCAKRTAGQTLTRKGGNRPGAGVLLV